MVLFDKNLYIHGGMAGATFHKDMHVINLNELRLVLFLSVKVSSAYEMKRSKG